MICGLQFLIFLIVLLTNKIFLVTAEIIRHEFVVSYLTGSPDGVWTNNILGINGEFPGPTIEGRQGDWVEVTVVNRIQDGQNLSIHWHGIHQRGTPFEDGASHITQCPLKEGSTQVYKFYLDQAGTYWYHSHVNSQYTEGLWGVLIVHDNSRHKLYANISNNDIIITLNDWYHSSAEENERWLLSNPENQGVPPFPSSVLMNGVGRYPCPAAIKQQRLCLSHRQYRPVFFIGPGTAPQRFRLINTSGYATFNFTIDEHVLTVIEVDGIDSQPIDTEAISIAAGQRYSFFVRCNQDGIHNNKYLIRARLRTEFLFTLPDINVNPNPEMTLTEVTGVIQYTKSVQRRRNPHFVVFDYTRHIPKLQWTSLKFLDETLLLPEDGTLAPNFIDIEVTLDILFINDRNGMRRGTFNENPFTHASKEPYLFSMIDGKPSNDSSHVPLRYGDIVQVVINNPMLGSHPLHLHGHHFWVMGKGKTGDGSYRQRRHKLKNTGYRRDTITVLENSWVVIRFRANNVGIWSFHCHVDWHYITGMAVVFVEGPEMVHKLKLPKQAKRICNEHKFL